MGSHDCMIQYSSTCRIEGSPTGQGKAGKEEDTQKHSANLEEEQNIECVDLQYIL